MLLEKVQRFLILNLISQSGHAAVLTEDLFHLFPRLLHLLSNPIDFHIHFRVSRLDLFLQRDMIPDQ